MGFAAGDSSASAPLLDAAVFLRRFFGGSFVERASFPLEIGALNEVSPMSASSSEVSIKAFPSHFSRRVSRTIERRHLQLTCKLSLSLYQYETTQLVSLQSLVLASSLSSVYHNRGQIRASSFSSAYVSHQDLTYVEILQVASCP